MTHNTEDDVTQTYQATGGHGNKEQHDSWRHSLNAKYHSSSSSSAVLCMQHVEGFKATTVWVENCQLFNFFN